jgi:hypothetical protein
MYEKIKQKEERICYQKIFYGVEQLQPTKQKELI